MSPVPPPIELPCSDAGGDPKIIDPALTNAKAILTVVWSV